MRPRMTLDYQLHLFENMYKAGPHKLERGRLVHATPPARPLVVHFNGPAKVSFEAEWRLPLDAIAGLTPVRQETASHSSARRSNVWTWAARSTSRATN